MKAHGMILVAFLPAWPAAAGVVYLSQTRSVSAYAYGASPITLYAPDFGPWSEQVFVPGALFGGGGASQSSMLQSTGISYQLRGDGMRGNMGTGGGGSGSLDVTFVVEEPTAYLIDGVCSINTSFVPYSALVRLTGPSGVLYEYRRDIVNYPGYGSPFTQSGLLEAGQYRFELSAGAGAMYASNTTVVSGVLHVPVPGTALCLAIGSLLAARRRR